MAFITSAGLVLSEKHISGITYVNLGELLAKALKDEDLSGKFLPMKAWDALKFILKDGTNDGVLAIQARGETRARCAMSWRIDRVDLRQSISS